MNTKAVIFDMDGVLIDSKQIHFEAWRDSGKKYGFEITIEKYTKYFGQTSEVFAEAICKENGVAPEKEFLDEWMILKEEIYTDKFKESYQEDRNVTNLIKNLNDNGFRTGIGSSAPRGNITDLVEVMPHGELMKEIVSGDDVVNGKPDPEVFLKVAGKLGVLANRCAVIEDSVHGLTAARKAGMVAIGITTTHNKEILAEHADLVIDCLSEVDHEKISDLIES